MGFNSGFKGLNIHHAETRSKLWFQNLTSQRVLRQTTTCHETNRIVRRGGGEKKLPSMTSRSGSDVPIKKKLSFCIIMNHFTKAGVGSGRTSPRFLNLVTNRNAWSASWEHSTIRLVLKRTLRH